MATKEQLEKLINEVIDIGVRNNFKDYERYFNDVISASSDLVGTKPSVRKILERISTIGIPKTAFLRQTYNMNLLSGIGMVSGRVKLPPEDLQKVVHIQKLVNKYPVSNPKKLASKIDAFSKAYITGAMVGLGASDLEIFVQVKKHFDNNREFIRKELVKNEKQLEVVHKKIKHNVSKSIVKDMKRLIRSRKTEQITKNTGELATVKRPLSVEEIRAELNAKYGDQVKYRVDRIVNTELHDLSEKSNINNHLLMGYTHKTWNTQGDARVRPAKGSKSRGNHRAMNGKTIPIDRKFNMVGGGSGMYPSDPSLPPHQRINCRCYLTYEKRGG